jgi:uncharacterized protein YegP (UPF0339 family)
MDQRPSGHFQVGWIRGRTELWGFKLERDDGKRVMSCCSSWCSQHEMEEAIAWVKANAARVEMARFKGRPRRPPVNRRRPRQPLPTRWVFWLTDERGKVVLSSLPYESEEEAEEAIAWVKTVAPHAEVRIENPPTPPYLAWRRQPRELP